VKTHPLKLVSLISLTGLIVSQAGLVLWLEGNSGWISALLLGLPLLVPLRGVINDRRYTFKWIGFMAMFYVAIGISESFTTPELRIYGSLTLVFSCALFVSSIYYSRFLRGA
jgi:uncharacterized membrane protein